MRKWALSNQFIVLLVRDLFIFFLFPALLHSQSVLSYAKTGDDDNDNNSDVDDDGGILQSLCKLKINSEMQKTMISAKQYVSVFLFPHGCLETYR